MELLMRYPFLVLLTHGSANRIFFCLMLLAILLRYYYLKDGKVHSILDKDYIRDGLRYMNELYEEGLIDPAAFTGLCPLNAFVTTIPDRDTGFRSRWSCWVIY